MNIKAYANDLSKIIDKQAEDEWLWFVAETVAEAYVQRELRIIHRRAERLVNAINSPHYTN